MRTSIAAFVILLSGISQTRNAEPTDPEVERLVTALDAEERLDRERAEKELLLLGPKALKSLPPFDDPKLNAEQRQRLRRLIPALWQAKLEQDVAGSKVSLGADSLPLLDAYAKLSEISGNVIADMRGEFNQELTNPPVKLPANDFLFWQAADALADQSGTSFYFHTEDRKLGVLGRPKVSGPVAYAGAIRLEATRIVLERFFADPDEPSSCIIQTEGLIEPRLHPLLFEVDTTKLRAKDDKGRPLAFIGPQAYPVMIDPATFQFPLQFRTEVPVRDATSIAEIAGELTVCLPSHVETIHFEKLEGPPAEITTPGLKVTLGEITNDEGIWSFPIEITYLISAVSLDSHLEASLQNQVWLVDKEGKRIEQNGGMNVVPSDDGVYRVEYLFVDIAGKPADYTLRLEIPAGIARVPVPFSLKDLSLP